MIIKRGAGFMLLRFGDIAFKDYMNFSVGLSLEKFAASVGISESVKMAYPYEKYQTVSSLQSAIAFPSYGEFENSLYAPSTSNVKKMNEIILENMSKDVWKSEEDIATAMDISSDEFDSLWDKTKKCFSIDESSQKFFALCPEKYLYSKKYFAESCTNMMDYLAEYNILDCRILLKSILAHAKGFLDDYQVNVHQSLSLPGIAQESF